MAVYRVYQRTDVFRRGELADAMAEVKNMRRTVGGGVGMRLAEAVQNAVYLGGDLRWWRKQNVGVDIAL